MTFQSLIITFLILKVISLYMLGFIYSMYFEYPIASIDEEGNPFVTEEPSKSYVIKRALIWPATSLKIIVEDLPEIMSELFSKQSKS